tara:strand:- start:361 stop:984 length:624 start_codon:yes stop_codon:yes gene_type:complete
MDVLKTFDADFAWWGKRTYVHGSHMTYQLLDAVKAWGLGNIDKMLAAFHSNLFEQGTYLLYEGKRVEQKFPVSYKLKIRDQDYFVGIKGNGKKVALRLEDDEAQLIQYAECDKDAKTAFINKYQTDRYINVIIALNKKLLNETISSEGYSGWLLAQLELNFDKFDIAHMNDLKIRLTKNIGRKMCMSTIEANKIKIGEIFFNRKTLS